jgi:hypothetical protein
LALQPGEMLQVHHRSSPCVNGSQQFSEPGIRVSTDDDVTESDHVVSLFRACRF